VLEQGQWPCSEEGTPQGGSASPLLANVYLHYMFDLWVQQWRKTKAKGDVIVVRWADDFVVGFEHQADAAVPSCLWPEAKQRNVHGVAANDE
jgi:retron-type reverse transcriptase